MCQRHRAVNPNHVFCATSAYFDIISFCYNGAFLSLASFSPQAPFTLKVRLLVASAALVQITKIRCMNVPKNGNVNKVDSDRNTQLIKCPH